MGGAASIRPDRDRIVAGAELDFRWTGRNAVGEPAAPRRERRAEARRVVSQLADIRFAGSRERVTCLVCDISSVGAQIETAATGLPRRFVLVNHFDGSRAVCETVWRRGRRMGVRFLTAPRTAR